MTYHWQGERVRLRAAELNDKEVHIQSNYDSSMERALDQMGFPQSSEQVRMWLESEAQKKADDQKESIYLQIESLETGEHVGEIRTFNCYSRTGTFFYGFGIFEAHRRMGYASDAVKILLRHYFMERRYQKCELLVYSFNEASLAFHRDFGFTEEGRLRRMGYTQGDYYDYVFFGMTIEEYVERYATFLE